MGKPILSAVRFPELSRIMSSANGNSKRTTTIQKQTPRFPNTIVVPAPKHGKMETLEGTRMPLSHVVADCANRWFLDTLKEAKAGDASMQILVAHMYLSGYGVPKDPQKGNAWINKAARSRDSTWKQCDKHIGYRTSDSDSDS